MIKHRCGGCGGDLVYLGTFRKGSTAPRKSRAKRSQMNGFGAGFTPHAVGGGAGVADPTGVLVGGGGGGERGVEASGKTLTGFAKFVKVHYKSARRDLANSAAWDASGLGDDRRAAGNSGSE